MAEGQQPGRGKAGAQADVQAGMQAEFVQAAAGRGLQIPIWVIAALVVCHALYFARTLVAPVVVSLLLYLTLRPLVVRMQRYGLPHLGSALILLVAFIGLLIVGVATVITPARGWLNDLPVHLETLEAKAEGIRNPFEAIEDASEKVEDIATDAEERAEKPVEVQIQQPQWTDQWYLVNGTSAVVGFIVLTVVLAFFLLATGDALINNLLHVLPSFSERRRVVELILELQGGISSYLGQVTLINVGLGVAVAIAMALLGMPSPLLWGTMATLLNFIPFLGALIGAAVIFLAAAITFEPLSWAFMTTAVYLTLTTIEGNFITPSLLGKTLQLSPVMVLLSLAFWGWMWGLVGIFVAVPLLIVARLGFEHFAKTRSLAVLLGAKDPAAEETEETEAAEAAEEEVERSDAVPHAG
ncbi:AI-2E family transporter [Candidatus Laterigemmans baculatus]|uniref:AI-2E family transporter n=1 Tax=Candidatus Laterigemmans baculatus TaxID=2770505 RepID=UPI0013DAE5AC|nr:AI-2E family transporter [Candidatus Laterigemmans baculatus]